MTAESRAQVLPDVATTEGRRALLEALIAPVRAAGEAVEEVRRRGAQPRTKADKSPVTEADEAAEAIIEAALEKLTPDIPIIGEEAFAAGTSPEVLSDFWLIDPVDGTREFVRGGKDYTVNVGLVIDHVPVLGVIMLPRDGIVWAGGVGLGCFREDGNGRREELRTKPIAGRPLIILASYRHRDTDTNHYLATLPEAKVSGRGSSIKFCLLAEGKGDLYPRWYPCSEWDTAAGHGLLRGAGGEVFDVATGEPLRYAKPGFENTPFIAVGDAEGALHRRFMPWQRGMRED